MNTPSTEQLDEFARQLIRALGNTLQAVVLHGSLVDNPDRQDDEQRDADLLVIVADLVLDAARGLIERLRTSPPFGQLNLAINTSGYQELCNHLAAGHPFFVSAIDKGKFLRCRKGVDTDLKAQIQPVDPGVVRERLSQYADIEAQRAVHAQHELFRSLVSLAYNHLQMDWLRQYETPEHEGRKLTQGELAELADWERLIDGYSGSAEDKERLRRLFKAKWAVSRGKQPKLCTDCYQLLSLLRPNPQGMR